MYCISSAGCYFIAEQGEFFMEQNLRKKAIPFIGVVAVLALILFVTFFSGDKLSADFHGTYAAGQGPYSIYFSVDTAKDNSFFYADQSEDVYIRGTVQRISDNQYELVCDHDQSRALIKDQVIGYQDNGFQLTVSDMTAKFEKIDNIPSIFGDESQYN